MGWGPLNIIGLALAINSGTEWWQQKSQIGSLSPGTLWPISTPVSMLSSTGYSIRTFSKENIHFLLMLCTPQTIFM
jgi:hypothetical protein